MNPPQFDSVHDHVTPENINVPCPECGRYTDSLKLYRLPNLWLFLWIFIRYSSKGYVCCPSCMRKKILLHGFTYNIVTANLIWPVVILPWSIIYLLRSCTKGHSHEVVDMIRQQTGM